MMGQRPADREKIRKRREKRYKRYFLCLGICCFLAFFAGKTAGKAETFYRMQTLKNTKQQAGEIFSGTFDADHADAGEEGADGGRADGTDAQEQPGSLILVNRDNPLPVDYAPELVWLQDGVHQSAKEAYSSLCDMLRAGIKEGLTFEICSAYRSIERQRQLFEEDVNALTARGMSYERAYEEVAKETMPPGCSEHNTGLAFDIVAFDYQMLDEGQERTDENIWLRRHCAEYGFILRYPKGTEDITGISYESWHFRYVGREAAEYITEQGITLEEYLQG